MDLFCFLNLQSAANQFCTIGQMQRHEARKICSESCWLLKTSLCFFLFFDLSLRRYPFEISVMQGSCNEVEYIYIYICRADSGETC